MQEGEIKILSPLFLITDDCEPLVLYKPPDSSRKGAQFLRSEPTLSPSPPPFYFLQTPSLKIRLRWAKKAKILASSIGGRDGRVQPD